MITAIFLLLLSACAAQPASRQDERWFSNDKYLHFLVSTAISASVAKAAKEDGREDCDAALIGFGFTISLGAAKESYDKRKRKTFYSYHDMVWNTAGSVTGSLLGSNCHL